MTGMALGEGVPPEMGDLVGADVGLEGPMRVVIAGVRGQTASPHFHWMYPAVSIRSYATQNSLYEDHREHAIYISV